MTRQFDQLATSVCNESDWSGRWWTNQLQSLNDSIHCSVDHSFTLFELPVSSLPWSLQTQDGLWAVGAGSRKRARIRAAKVALAVAAKLGALHVFVEIGKHRNHYCTFENAAVQTVFFLVPSPDVVLFGLFRIYVCFVWLVCMCRTFYSEYNIIWHWSLLKCKGSLCGYFEFGLLGVQNTQSRRRKCYVWVRLQMRNLQGRNKDCLSCGIWMNMFIMCFHGYANSTAVGNASRAHRWSQMNVSQVHYGLSEGIKMRQTDRLGRDCMNMYEHWE